MGDAADDEAKAAPKRKGGWAALRMKKRPWSEIEENTPAAELAKQLRVNQDHFDD